MWLIIIILLIILYILWYQKNYSLYEYFTMQNIKIIQKINDSFEIDDYKAYDENDKEIIKSGGKWNLINKDFYVEINNKKIKINDNNNIYLFKTSNNYDVSLIYKNNENCGDIIINNHMDEIKCCHTKDGYMFSRKNKNIAEIKLEKEGNKEKKYSLDILDKSTMDYRDIYVIAFIIFNQTNKELSISLDKIL